MRRALSILPPVLFAFGLVLVWHFVADYRLVSPVFLPTPERAFGDLAARFADGAIWEPLASTVGRMIVGWFLASLLGIAIGAAIGLTPLMRDLLEPTLEFLRPIPASAMIPVGILFLGLSDKMAVSVIAFGSIWPVLMSSIFGFGAVRERLQEVAALLGLSRWEFLTRIAIPSAMPDILAGMRSGLAVSLILAVVTEMQASLPGLGYDIFLAQRNFRSGELYAGLIMLGLLGVIINRGLQIVERRVLRWRPDNF
ncbi:MAG: transporter permease [Hyphomicrobiales bacterium]|jgi:ABC-type nitrate/sulfonate/bicarbonate transport system permease component|nr:transporter permease [Hyphomicrobiales bacterium]